MFYYGNTNSNNDHHDSKPIPTNHHNHHHHHHHSNRDQHHLDTGSFSAGDSFPPYFEQQQDPSSAAAAATTATAQNIPMQQQQQQHSSMVNDSSLYFTMNNDPTLQPFDSSSFLNDPLLSLAGQEYDMPRSLDDLQLQHQDGFDTHRDLSAYVGVGSWNQSQHNFNNNHNNNSNSYNSNNNEHMMMAFSQQQQVQPQQQQQQQYHHHHQQQHLFSSLSPDNRQHEAENAILNAFTALGQQDEQAILFSDPNFVRQQQLLQEQQRMMHMRQEQEDTGMMEGVMDTTNDGTTATTAATSGSMMMRSNLSAMLDETSSDDKADDRDPNVTCSLQAPSLDSSSFAAAAANTTTTATTADQNARLLFSPATPAPEFKQQQQQEQHQQQPWEKITTFSKKQQQQQQQRRATNTNNNARASKRTSSPIPIKGIASSCSNSSNRPVSSSVPSEVDHQRRQNELQARFRITYARKPQQLQQQMQKVGGRSSSSAAAAMVTPSSFSGNSAAHVQPPSTLGTSVPNLPSTTTTTNMKDFDLDSVMSSPQIALTPDPVLVQSSSPLRNYEDFKGSLSSLGGGEVGGGGSNMDGGQQLPPTASPSLSSATAIPGVGGGGNNNAARAASKSPSAQHQAVNFPSRTMPIQIQRVQRASVPQPLDAEQHQRKLDDQLEKVNFDDITVSELKDMLRQRGKPATGKKAVLVQRLMDERDFIRAVKSGKAQRYSQPPPPPSSSSNNNNNKLGESGRPRSYQGTMSSPHNASLPQSPLLVAGSSPSSMPNSFIPPGSPGSVTYSLNRSIANMHIGSPPPSQHPRRYSPYATPGSPRMNSASPKLQPQKQHQQYQQQQHANYSSSMPTTNAMMSSSPSSFTYGSPLSSSFTSRARPINAYVSNGRPPKTYAPFTSSALATPDRDEDHDPFDDFAMEDQGYNIKREEEEEVEDYIKQENNNPNDYPTSSSLPTTTTTTTTEPIKLEGLDNTDPDSFLKNANIPESAFHYLSEGFTREDLLAVLAGQGLGDPNNMMGLQAANSIMEGCISNDTTTSAPTNNMMPFDHLDNLNRYQHEGHQENGPR